MRLIGRATKKRTRGTGRTPLEHVEQCTVVDWLQWQHIPHFAVPNGGTSPKRLGKLRAEGLSAGVPDLILPVHRIAIEMKRRGAKASATTPEQAAWIETLKNAGWEARVCHGSGEAITWLRELGMERIKRMAL